MTSRPRACGASPIRLSIPAIAAMITAITTTTTISIRTTSRSWRRPRRQKRSLSRHGRTGRDLAIAAGLALSLSTVTGAAVYDRASGGTIAAAIMAPFAGETENQAVAEVPNVIVTTEEPLPRPQRSRTGQSGRGEHRARAVAGAAAGRSPNEALATGDIKPIATAKLEVADATGIANTPVDLDLRAVPGQAGQDLELRVSGVPEDANLTAGTKISPTSWSLKPAEAAIVKLVMPAQRSGEFDLSVAAVEAKTGELVAPMQEINVTVGSATPTEQAAEPPAPAAAKKGYRSGRRGRERSSAAERRQSSSSFRPKLSNARRFRRHK